jgi:hypothetical protein
MACVFYSVVTSPVLKIRCTAIQVSFAGKLRELFEQILLYRIFAVACTLLILEESMSLL